MPSDLDLLIDHYQWEVQRIKALIEEHKEMHFYEEVILDNRALQSAYGELDRLLALRKPNHNKIQYIEHRISSMKRMEERMIKKYGSLYDSSSIKVEIRVLEKELKELSKPKVGKREETQVLDDVLYKLIEDNQEQISIFIDSYQSRLMISIVKIDDLIFQTELYLTDIQENSYLKNKSVLKELQFVFDAESKKFRSSFTLSSRKNILPFKEYFARLIFGLKRDLELVDELYIKLD